MSKQSKDNISNKSIDTCDLYCDNRMNEKNKFKCGSSNDSRIWTQYYLNRTCPLNALYIKELNECILVYSGYLSSCPDGYYRYIFNRNVTWSTFQSLMKKFNLTENETVVEFDDDVTIDKSWKCNNTGKETLEEYSYSQTNRYFYSLSSHCLRPYSYAFKKVNRLCTENRLDEISSLYFTDDYRYFGKSFDAQWYKCPTDWFDINKVCYRISNRTKTIEEAKQQCMEISKLSDQKVDLSLSPTDDTDVKDEIIHTSTKIFTEFLQGKIVEYRSEWEARLGFYLLDKSKIF